MFGTANQLLAAVALSVTTTMLMNSGRERYAWVTIVPMLFVATTTLTAGWLNITDNFLPLTSKPGMAVQGYVNSALTAIMMVCAVVVLFEAAKRWYRVLIKGEYPQGGEPLSPGGKSMPPHCGCC